MNRTILGVFVAFSLGACGGSGSGLPGGHLTADPRGLSAGGAGMAAPPGAEATDSAADIAQAIEEANIYRLDGDRLYLLNAWGGFVVVDLAAPSLTGSLALRGVPLEMYLRDQRAFVLLTTVSGDTELREVSVADPAQPELVATHAMTGDFRTSRLVGDLLLVLAGDTVHSFVIEPELAAGDSLPVPGGAQLAHTTDGWIFVAAPEAQSATRVTLVEVTGASGALALRGSVSLPGYVSDEYKLNFGAGHLRVVTHDWSDGELSRLFVVDVSDPSEPYIRSSLDLVRGEQLFATRFTEDRAYVVTFLQIDPLWVIDLADPDQPRISGTLEVPGWSTHLVALPDRLVALGIDPAEGWHAIVSLFDVSDPEHPTLASRVDFGWGWSSAFEDVRGFGVFADEGLVLVPFAGEANRLAVLALDGSGLALNGWIGAEGTVLRGFPHARGLCALSIEEVVVADPATLAVTGRVTIASDVADLARLADGTLIEAVRRSSGCRVGAVELPLWLSRMVVHGNAVAVTGWDAQGSAAFVVDFAATPPAVRPRIALGASGFPDSLPGGWGGSGAPSLAEPGWGPPASSITAGGRLVMPGLAAQTPDLVVGSGALQDGFTVIDVGLGHVESTIGVRGAFVTGFLTEGEQLVFTHGRYVGDDHQGRPLLRHELVQVDLATLAAGAPVNVPGYVVSRQGARVHTVEETWGDDWSFDVAVVTTEITAGHATVLARLPLPRGAYDFRTAGSTLWFSAYGAVTMSWPPDLPGSSCGPSGTISTVRLDAQPAFGPELVFDDHFASLAFAEEGSALVVVDGVALEHWDVTGPTAERSWSAPLGAWPQSVRADAVPGTYLLALGYGGALTVP